MRPVSTWQRGIRRVRLLWRSLLIHLGLKKARFAAGSYVDAHTNVTFRALIDAVIPRTPGLVDELGPEHEPGGLAIELDQFVVRYIDSLFQFGLPHVGPRGNLPLAAPTANLLDMAALKLLSRGRNEDEPDLARLQQLYGDVDGSWTAVSGAAGPFAVLSREDRLRAITILDEFDLEVAPFRGLEIEIDGGLIGQLTVGFSELLYYSEWEGYDEFFRPPSERTHQNDPSAVLSWQQTGYPGPKDGYAALRGYLGFEGPLGDGESWSVVDDTSDPDVHIVRRPGSFRENEYDTSDYEEVYPEDI